MSAEAVFWLLMALCVLLLLIAARISGPRPRCQHCGMRCRPGFLIFHETLDHTGDRR